jgi:hypothetical protein
MVFYLYLSILFYFLFSLSKMARPHICTLMYASSKTPTYPRGKFRYFLSKQNWHARWDMILLPSLLRFEGRQGKIHGCIAHKRSLRLCIKMHVPPEARLASA